MTTYQITPVPNPAITSITPTSVQVREHRRQVVSITVAPLRTTSSVTLRQSRHFRMVSGKQTVSTLGAGKLRQNKANLFKHFAHYDVGGVDPALALVAGKTSGVAAYDTSTPSNFRRVSAAVVVPNDYPVSDGYAWQQASFVGVGARVKSMAVGNFALLDAAQVELAKNGIVTPSSYAPARALVCNVRPNRLNTASNPSWRTTNGTTTARTNQIKNPAFRAKGSNYTVRRNYMLTPSFAGGTGNWGTAATYWSNPATISTDATWSVSGTGTSLKVTTDGTAILQGPNISLGLAANAKYTISATVKNTSGLNVQLSTRDTTNSVNGTTSATVAAGSTARISSVITMGATANPSLLVAVTTVNSTGTATTFNVDQIMVEYTDSVLPYFDGTTATDAASGWAYSWTGTAWNSPSDWVCQLVPSNISPYGNNKGGVSNVSNAMHLFQTQSSNGGLWAYYSARDIPAAAGDYWAGRYQIRQVGGTGPITITPRTGTYTSSNSFVGYTGTGSNITLTNDGAWYDAVIPADTVAAANTAHATIFAYSVGLSSPPGTRIEIRNVILDKVPANGLSVGAYFDGTTAPTMTGLSYSWTGTADASTSIETGKGLPGSSANGPVWQGEADGLGGYFARTKNAGYVLCVGQTTATGSYWAASIVLKGTPGTSATVRLNDGTRYISAADSAGKNTTSTFTLPASGQMNVTLYSNLPSSGGKVHIYVYPSYGEFGIGRCLLEQVSGPGMAPGDYFDGSSGPDYLWQQGITGENGASFYYKNYLSRSYLLKQVLVENSPLGTTPAVPQFGILPLT